MSTKIFVNLPVKDLKRSITFFQKLDFKFNQRFTDEHATCMTLGENIFVLLLSNPFFKSFSNKAICNTNTSAEVIVALSTDSRARVDELTDLAIAAGALSHTEPQDQGFMYSRSFEDLDGHLWEVVYMNPSAIN